MQPSIAYRSPHWGWVIASLAAILLVAIFFEGLEAMVGQWSGMEEYSHGFLLPFIALFLIWQKKDRLEVIEFTGAWAGLALTIFGFALYVAGELSTLFIIVQYAFLVVVMGVALSLLGWRGFKLIFVPLVLLVLMIPLPNFLYQSLSSQLQLISSEIGVAVIRLFGISVYLEGNVIDLGSFKMQVVEACSGLRYLFPLMTLGFVAAYFFKGVFWKRTVIFLSTIPITVLMNSFRIGMIGITVEFWGPEMAEGFLHDFEGWVVFMASTAVLVAEMWLFAKFGKESRPLREVFGLDFPAPTPAGAQRRVRTVPTPFIASSVIILGVAVAAGLLPERTEVPPPRKDFGDFPLELGEWKGKGGQLESIYIDALKFDDYVIADFTGPSAAPINFYAAYYASQKKGESAHSPRTCIPGGGWEITSLEQRTIPNAEVAGKPLKVNRAVIQLGDTKQLVYYWFQQRGRVITNEYLVKWFLFWDALTRNRTDGALVRLTTLVLPGQDIIKADAALSSFAAMAAKPLGAYIPD